MKLPKFLKKRLNRIMVTSIPSKIDKDGYAVATVGSKHCYVHDLIASSCIPNPDGKKYVIHKDGDKLNNHVSNLAWSDIPER